MTLKFTIELDFDVDSTMYPTRTKEEWKDFLEEHFMPNASVLGEEDDDEADLIFLNSYTLEVL